MSYLKKKQSLRHKEKHSLNLAEGEEAQSLKERSQKNRITKFCSKLCKQ
jgi:hypothetical protein